MRKGHRVTALKIGKFKELCGGNLYLFIYLFIFGCVGSSLLRKAFLKLL